MVRKTETLIRLTIKDKETLIELSKKFNLSLSETVAKLLNSQKLEKE
jgi:hypothetical protein